MSAPAAQRVTTQIYFCGYVLSTAENWGRVPVYLFIITSSCV